MKVRWIDRQMKEETVRGRERESERYTYMHVYRECNGRASGERKTDEEDSERVSQNRSDDLWLHSKNSLPR